MDADAGIWIAGLGFAFTVFVAFSKGFQWLGRLDGRVHRLEEERDEEKEVRMADAEDRRRSRIEMETMFAALRGQMTMFGDTISQARLEAAKSYVKVEDFRKLDDKMDTIFKSLSRVTSTQAGHGEILKAVQASLTDLKPPRR